MTTVTITEIYSGLANERYEATGDYPEEGSLHCEFRHCGATIGLVLEGDYDTPRWITYFEIKTVDAGYPPGSSDLFCEDCITYLEEIAPALLAHKNEARYV